MSAKTFCVAESWTISGITSLYPAREANRRLVGRCHPDANQTFSNFSSPRAVREMRPNSLASRIFPSACDARKNFVVIMHSIVETFVETLVGMLAPELAFELTLRATSVSEFRSPLVRKIGIDS